MSLSRRQFLMAGAAASLVTSLPKFALAATSPNDTRLVVVLLRGGLDGLHALPRPNDSDYLRLRGALGEAAIKDAHPIDGGFALHPSLAFASQLYAAKEFLPVVAVAPPYRERSHFEAQDCVENGTQGPGGRNGWMNRCVQELGGSSGLAITAVMPLIMRGNSTTTTWSPPLAHAIDPILMQHLQVLYARDAVLGPAFAHAGADESDVTAKGGDKRGHLADAMGAAAHFMSAADGPRIAFVEDTGWDTHYNEAGILQRKLSELDSGLQAFKTAGDAIWPRTAIVVVTEFGRTAAVNGTNGTDHGTGGVAFLAGGAVNGGRVAGTWPGLANSQLNERRDLLATSDMRGMFKGVLESHLRVSAAASDARVFPASTDVAVMRGLIRNS
ncbi:hypothetical protein Lysil_1162 [Lysobacter silvestris]|uniref:DUF1501 domain-containing protein n=2 Tax=Solilutibacter silvestris TaxID=1645665 RepID=A0A2K1Q3E4_9GAMM|nr:hypothetical protein Lysil_1162 [Lysobacter silvestris]